MKYIRVKAVNAERFANSLRAMGYVANVVENLNHTYAGGCTDPMCCPQHVSLYKPSEWKAIETNCSGSKFHKLLLAGKL